MNTEVNWLKSFTDAHQGNANISVPEKHSPNWDLVKDVLVGKKPLSTLFKKCPPNLIYEE